MVSLTFSIKAIVAFHSFISATNAHMVMKTPIPYGRGSINNSPLANDGSDYPCKNVFNLADPAADVNHLAPGVANTLSFTGSAVHGGGSCQIALTTDLRPTKSSKWMVIKSIEGGCPANVDGNLPADPNGNSAAAFQYTVPAGFTQGEYTIAWTWFNRIGNREMYMNCGRASVANAKKRYAPSTPQRLEPRATSLPDLFTANLQIFQCTVAEGTNVKFPNPGPDVEVKGTVTAPGNCNASLGGNTGAGVSFAVSSAAVVTTKAASTSAVAPSSATAKTPTTPAQGSNTRPTVSPGNFASGAASQSTPVTSLTTDAAPSQRPLTTVQPFLQPSANAGSSNGSSTGSTTPGTACTEEGAWLCAAGGLWFQRCASGRWSAAMQVATGTTCTPGQSMKLNMKLVSYGIHRRSGATHQHHRRAIQLS